MSYSNRVIIAAAGSRKTTYVVEEALKDRSRRILIVTYTVDNVKQLTDYVIEQAGHIPENIHIQSWFSFLLQECVRPYQNFHYDKERIETILFIEGKSAPYVSKTAVGKYFFADGNRIYTDKISEFSCICNEKSGGLVINRLSEMYDAIYVDEVQDFAGYDFDILKLLFESKINLMAVGDTRQATFFTNCSPKNSKFKGQNIICLFKEWEKTGLCIIEERNECYRCNQAICDFADALYPGMPKTISKNDKITGHDGLFLIRKEEIEGYLNEYKPQVLQYRKSQKTVNINPLNFGLSKGKSFSRVLIFPTEGIEYYLKNNKLDANVGDIPKFYVAVTRARHSVAFVYNGPTSFSNISFYKKTNHIQDRLLF